MGDEATGVVTADNAEQLRALVEVAGKAGNGTVRRFFTCSQG